MDLEHLWGAGELDAVLGEDRHQDRTERLELLLRVPDLADPKIATGTERDVVVEPVGRPLASRLLMRGCVASYFSAEEPGAGVKRTRMLMAFSSVGWEATLSQGSGSPPSEERASFNANQGERTEGVERPPLPHVAPNSRLLLLHPEERLEPAGPARVFDSCRAHHPPHGCTETA